MDAPSPARIRPSSGPLGFSLAHSSLLLLKEQWISEMAQSLLVMVAAVPVLHSRCRLHAEDVVLGITNATGRALGAE